MTDNDPNVQRRRLKTALREHRERAGLTQRGAAAAVYWSPSKLIRIEAGLHGVSVTDLHALLDLYGVRDKATIGTLTELAQASRGRPWWHDYRDIVSPQFATYLGYEGSASSLTAFHPFLLPGLLHTAAYAAALLDLLDDPERTTRIVELKERRKQQLLAESAVRAVFIVNEEALYRWIGGRYTMREQLMHVREMSGRPNVEVKVIPFSAGAHAGLCGSFTMVSIDELDERLIFLESMNGDKIIKDDRVSIEQYETYLADLFRLALAPAAGDALLREQIERLR